MHQYQTDHGEHKARQQLDDHGMYPEIEAAKGKARGDRVTADYCVYLPKEHRIRIEVHMVHGLVLPRRDLQCLTHLEHKVRGQAEDRGDDEGEDDCLSGMCEQKVGTVAVRMSVDKRWKQFAINKRREEEEEATLPPCYSQLKRQLGVGLGGWSHAGEEYPIEHAESGQSTHLMAT